MNYPVYDGTSQGHLLIDYVIYLIECPRRESNLRSRLRRAVLYPLSYGGNFVAVFGGIVVSLVLALYLLKTYLKSREICNDYA